MSGFVAGIMGALFGGGSSEPVDWKEKALQDEQRIRWHRLEEAQTNGWKNWIPSYMDTLDHAGTPYDYPRVWIWRPEWDYPSEVDPNRLHPAMNVNGLLWKPWAPSTPTLDKPT